MSEKTMLERTMIDVEDMEFDEDGSVIFWIDGSKWVSIKEFDIKKSQKIILRRVL